MAPGAWRWGPLAALAAVALGLTGWGLLVAAVAAGVWGMGGGQSSAVTAVIVTRGLWADCATDASGVTSCVPLVSLVTLPGLASVGAALWFGVGSSQEFFDPSTLGVRFEPGPAVLQAGGGGALQAVGGGALLWMARAGPARPRPAATPPPTLGEKYGRNEYV
ncbi:claudin-7-like isoform X2 [Vidua chalybeata]|uniref:claudin-7-like isoform X2 n=1 Tax=Vidua chalybeata TaxID=81927 RepID=UPI0023A82F01|nr:claudin-7-like isoform X2 [Vidua chalybeata]